MKDVKTTTRIFGKTQLEQPQSKEQQIINFCKSKKYFRYMDVTQKFGGNGFVNNVWQKIIREAERVRHPELDVFCYRWKKC